MGEGKRQERNMKFIFIYMIYIIYILYLVAVRNKLRLQSKIHKLSIASSRRFYNWCRQHRPCAQGIIPGLIWYLPFFLLHQNITSLFHFFFTINVSQIIFPLVLYTFVLSKYKIKRSCPMDCQIWSFRRSVVGTLEHPKSRSVSPSLIEPTSISCYP